MRAISKLSKWSAAALLGLLVAALPASAQMKQSTAVVKAINGRASFFDEQGLEHPLAVGATLKAGQTVRTGSDSSVDLFLGVNGPGLGLNANSVLRIDKLSSQDSPLGSLIDTELDLKQGQICGTVDKLLPGSRYEIKMPTGLATVRGTEYFIDAFTGTVFVTSGTVNVTVKLNIEHGPTLTKTVSVGAGYELVVPLLIRNESDFNNLKATKMPPILNQTTLRLLAQLHILRRYTTSASSVNIAETFEGDRLTRKGPILIERPPNSIVVSP